MRSFSRPIPGIGPGAAAGTDLPVLKPYRLTSRGSVSELGFSRWLDSLGPGVLIAAATGIGAWFNERPFLTSDFGYIHWPPLEEFEWATAILFDTGVFLAVLGAVMLALDSLSRFAWQPGMAQEFPMDINPLRDRDTKDDNEKEQA